MRAHPNTWILQGSEGRAGSPGSIIFLFHRLCGVFNKPQSGAIPPQNEECFIFSSERNDIAYIGFKRRAEMGFSRRIQFWKLFILLY